MTRLSIVLLAVVLTFGCGENAPPNPVAPSPAPASAGPAPVTGFKLSGVVTVPGPAGLDPCQGARIFIDNGMVRREAYSGESGRYTISGLPASTYTVTVTWPGFEPAQTTVELTQDTVVNFELQTRF
jgi:hypothetical protein